MIRRSIPVILISLIGVGVAFAKFTADVQQVPNLTDVVKTLALAPMQCPTGLDCLTFETKLVKNFERLKRFTVIPPARVRQALFEIGAKTVTSENREQLLRTLNADAIALPSIGAAGKSTGAVVMTGAPTSPIFVPVEESRVNATLDIVSPGGTQLFQGTGIGISDWNSMDGAVMKTFATILEKGFPKPTK